MSETTVLFDVSDGVAKITLNRPDAANAMNLELMRELMQISIRCDEDPGVRAAVVTGKGRFFSAGGDVADFGEADDRAGALIKEMTTHFHAAVSRFNRMDAPLIAAVNGMAAGAGWSFAASCDITIAAESAQFLSAYTQASLSPDGSSTYFVPRLIGFKRAMELMLLNRRLGAAEALDWGLVTKVVPDDELVEQAMSLAQEMASGPTLAYGAVKRLLHETFAGTLETQMEREAREIAALTHTHDGKEGVAAFLDKRLPKFEGR